MKFAKTDVIRAGVRPPVNIEINAESIPEGLPSGQFRFLDRNSIELTMENGTKSVVFLSRAFTYSEVKPLSDSLTSALPAAPEGSSDEGESKGEDEDENEGEATHGGDVEGQTTIPGTEEAALKGAKIPAVSRDGGEDGAEAPAGAMDELFEP